jgi:hypothetical protein
MTTQIPKRLRLSEDSTDRLLPYAFKLAEEINVETESEFGFIEKCKTKILSVPVEKEVKDIQTDDGTSIRSCMKTLIKINEDGDSLTEDAESTTVAVLETTMELLSECENNKTKYLLLLEVLVAARSLQNHKLCGNDAYKIDKRAKTMIDGFTFNIKGRSGLFNEDVAFLDVVAQSEEEELDCFNERVKNKIEALDEIIRVSHQLSCTGIAKTEYEQEHLLLLFKTATKELFDVGFVDIKTKDFEILTVNLKRIKRELNKEGVSALKREELVTELDDIKSELELHLYFSPDSFIAYVSALETVVNIATNEFSMKFPKTEKMKLMFENLYKLYYDADILDDCDQADRFSALIKLNECNNHCAQILVPAFFKFDDGFEEGIEVSNTCVNSFLLLEALARFMLKTPKSLPEIAKANMCLFKKEIYKIFK